MSREKARIEVREGAGGKSAFVAGTRTRVLEVARLFEIVQEELLMERMLEGMPHLSRDQISEALCLLAIASQGDDRGDRGRKPRSFQDFTCLVTFPLYLDEHIHPDLAKLLGQFGCDVLTARDAGNANMA